MERAAHRRRRSPLPHDPPAPPLGAFQPSPQCGGQGSPHSVCGIRVRVPTGLPGRLSGSSRRPSPSSRSRNSRHSRAFNFPVGLFQSSNSHTVRASSIRLRPPQLSTNSWIKLSSDELNRLPLKFAPLVPISLLATTTVANAGTNVQQKVTPLRVHNQSKFRYPLTNLTTSDRWTVRSLRKWAILAVPKEPHPINIAQLCSAKSRVLALFAVGDVYVSLCKKKRLRSI